MSPIGLPKDIYWYMMDLKLGHRANFLDTIYDLKTFCNLLVFLIKKWERVNIFFHKIGWSQGMNTEWPAPSPGFSNDGGIFDTLLFFQFGHL